MGIDVPISIALPLAFATIEISASKERDKGYTMLTKWLTRDKQDLIVGIDYDKAEVWLYSGVIVNASEWSDKTSFWFSQGVMLGAMV